MRAGNPMTLSPFDADGGAGHVVSRPGPSIFMSRRLLPQRGRDAVVRVQRLDALLGHIAQRHRLGRCDRPQMLHIHCQPDFPRYAQPQQRPTLVENGSPAPRPFRRTGRGP